MRYIDADKLCKGLKEMANVLAPFKQSTILGVVSTIENYPTADVVPKSEVDKTIAEWAYLHADVLNKLENAKAEVAREIFEEIEKTFIDSAALPDCARFVDIDKIAELKNKYTEDKE